MKHYPSNTPASQANTQIHLDLSSIRPSHTHAHLCSWCRAGKRVSVDIMCTVSRLPVLADVAVSWSGTITRSTITGSTIVTRAAAAAAVHVQLGGWGWVPGGSQCAGKAEARRGFMIDRSRAASWNHSLIFSFHHHLIAHKCGTVTWDQLFFVCFFTFQKPQNIYMKLGSGATPYVISISHQDHGPGSPSAAAFWPPWSFIM